MSGYQFKWYLTISLAALSLICIFDAAANVD